MIDYVTWEIKAGHDSRMVDIKKLHGITESDTKALLMAVDPRRGQKILDACCGDGWAGKTCLEKEGQIELHLVDDSSRWLDRARSQLYGLPKSRFSLSAFPKVHYKNGSFDTVIMKMGLHEVSKSLQVEVAKEVFRILKPDGKWVVWDVVLDERDKDFLKEIIREKDRCAKLERMAELRHFFTEAELVRTSIEAGFNQIAKVWSSVFPFSTEERFESELLGDVEMLDKLNSFIRRRFHAESKERLDYTDIGDDIRFNLVNGIYLVTRG
ncbi:MAG: methyltransferase domain-containing protein [Candidatus Micrarchaeota archaeon]|nr:methyltransferase domain-containing protein [Candidatus Micrarchaeota archaeon]